MIGFLLGLIPGPWRVVFEKLPWRLIGYALAAAAVVWAVLTINGWRLDAGALKATETALVKSREKLHQCTAREVIAQQAFTEAVAKAESIAASNRATAERVSRELTTKLADADRAGRDLARRLHDYQSRACPGGLPAAASLAGTVPHGGEPGGVGEAERLAEAIRGATADALAACARDGAALSAVGPWYDEIRETSGN